MRIIKDGLIDQEPFLDFSERINCCAERGPLNLAFPPDYATFQQFYVSYTNRDDDTVISRFNATANPDVADKDSEAIILVVDQPHLAHNSGKMAFGPLDGYLYIGVGDGGSFIEPFSSAQDSSTLLGAVLRIDVGSHANPYSIPGSNPFSNAKGQRGEIWVQGLRNPWGFAFDGGSGDLFIPDTGDAEREEVNFLPVASEGGANFGWGFMEGNKCFDHWQGICTVDGLTLPVVEYERETGCAVVGGVVYLGSNFPHLQDIFVFADFCSGNIWGLKRQDPQRQDRRLNRSLLNAGVPISSVGEDEEGQPLYHRLP